MSTKIFIGEVENGAMLTAPVYESHRRGRNWMAVINADPSSPGGLSREFVERGKGKYYYIVDEDIVGKPVEIAGDYFSGSGRRSPNRWYGVVRALTSTEITIEEFESPDDAIKAAQEGPDIDALQEERDRLIARLEEINKILNEVA